MFTSFRELKVWNQSMDLVDAVYDIVEKFPKSEQYILQPQILRSSISVPSNIAEGNARLYTGEYIHHVSIACGSLAELETQLEIAIRRRYVTREEIIPVLESTSAVGRMINGLIEALQLQRK